MITQVIEARYVQKKSLLELLKTLFDKGFEIEVFAFWEQMTKLMQMADAEWIKVEERHFVLTIPRKLTETEITSLSSS